MFHAAELKRRHEQEVELAERIGDAGVAFHPVERRRMEIEDRVAIAGDLGRVGFAMEHPHRAAVAFGALDGELPCGEREEIGRNRLCLRERHPRQALLRRPRHFSAVRERLPAFRHLKRQRPARFQIGLIETGKRLVRAGGDENCVEEFVVAVE